MYHLEIGGVRIGPKTREWATEADAMSAAFREAHSRPGVDINVLNENREVVFSCRHGGEGPGEPTLEDLLFEADLDPETDIH